MEEIEKKAGASEVPYIIYEGEMWRQEIICRRLIALAAVIFAAFVGSNLYWIVRFFG